MNAASKTNRTRPGPWYILKAVTVGVSTCPVEGATRREDTSPYVQSSNISGLYVWGLPTLALLKSRSAAPGTKVSTATPRRHKRSIVHVKPDRTVVERTKDLGSGLSEVLCPEREDSKNATVGFQPQAVL